MQCFKYLQKGQPSLHFTKTITNTMSEKQGYGKKYKSSKSSNSTNTSKAGSITRLRNYQIKIKKEFTTLNTRIEETENEDS